MRTHGGIVSGDGYHQFSMYSCIVAHPLEIYSFGFFLGVKPECHDQRS
jgi:hypothetical protein